MFFFPTSKKVAVTGLSQSGKTVFLLSLIQHLANFRSEDFPLRYKGRAASVIRFKEIPPAADFERLPVDLYRSKFIAQNERLNWPVKTKDIYTYRISFEYVRFNSPTSNRRTVKGFELEFLDFPGERLADAEIFRHEDYERWSEKILETMSVHPQLAKYHNAYIESLESLSQPREILNSYKTLLTAFIVEQSQLLSPSTFALGLGGDVFSEMDKNNQGRSRLCGLLGQEFAPIPAKIQSRLRETGNLFRSHYRTYRAEIVTKLFSHFNGCDQLLILSDIPGILRGGVHRYNGAFQAIGSLARILKPRAWYNFFGGLRKIAFVSTKLDLIHSEDADNLKELLEELMLPVKNQLAGRVEFKSFLAAAWQSTEETGLDHELRGILWSADNPDREVRTWTVSKVPPVWPPDWQVGQYKIRAVWPEPIPNLNRSPRQRGLAQIFDFIIF